MKKALLCIGFITALCLGVSGTASAVSLKVAPLEYRTVLKPGESKKGFIDVSNPTKERVVVNTSVQGFRQTDDRGSLAFYDDDQLSQAIKLDLDEFELGPHEAVRMYFGVDGKLLPDGDVYAGIFFTTEPTRAVNGSGQSVKLGSLLSIVNGTPGSRRASIISLSVPSFSLSDTIHGQYRIKNTGDPKASTGFYPQVSISAWPFGKDQTQTAKLIFAGRTRENNFTVTTLPFGIYRISTAFGGSSQSRWVVVAHPLVLIGLALAGVGSLLFIRLRQRRRGA